MSENFPTVHPTKQNVSNSERVASALIGSALLTHFIIGKKSSLKLLAGGFLVYRAISGHCPGYSAIKKLGIPDSKNITVKATVTVNKPVPEVYAFWRNLKNLPIFMKHLESVAITGEKTSSWKAKVPGRLGTIGWESTIVHDRPNERIGWQSNEGALVENAGTVHFRDDGKFGTEVHAIISYHAPAGKLGEGVTRLLNPVFEAMVLEDIKNFKRYIENGEIPTIKGQTSGNNKIS